MLAISLLAFEDNSLTWIERLPYQIIYIFLKNNKERSGASTSQKHSFSTFSAKCSLPLHCGGNTQTPLSPTCFLPLPPCSTDVHTVTIRPRSLLLHLLLLLLLLLLSLFTTFHSWWCMCVSLSLDHTRADITSSPSFYAISLAFQPPQNDPISNLL